MTVTCFLMDVRPAAIDRETWNALVRCLWRESDEHQDVTARIQRYHKGCASPTSFVAHHHEDTRCFLFGRLMLQASCAVAASSMEGERTTAQSVADNSAESRRRWWWARDNPLEAFEVLGSTTMTSLLRRTTRGKPFLAPSRNANGWSGNVSHAGRVVGMVEAVRGVLCGIDVMPIELSPWPSRLVSLMPNDAMDGCRCRFWNDVTVDDVENFFDDLEPYFTPTEWKWIRQPLREPQRHRGCPQVSNPNALEGECRQQHEGVNGKPCPKLPPPYVSLRRFYVNWTLKESYIKAVGLGLELELQRAEFHMPPNFDSFDGVDDEEIDNKRARGCDCGGTAAAPGLRCVFGGRGNRSPAATATTERPSCSAERSVVGTFAAPTSSGGICLFLDGQVQRQWTFGVWYWNDTESVGAVALGPSRDGVSPIFPSSSSLEIVEGMGEVDDGEVSVRFVRVSPTDVMRWYGVPC